jgi:ERCC4-type nuclease
MDINIIIDNREKKSFRQILSDENITYTVKYLSYGDIWFTDVNDQPIMIIERKTYDDLNSSIKDGRSHNQAFHLKEINKDSDIVTSYLVERKLSSKLIEFEDKIMQAMTNKQVRDGLMIFHTQGPIDTAKHIKRIQKCLAKHGSYKSTMSKETFTSTIKLPKCSDKKNIKCIYICMLRCIPSVSDSMATSIVNKYKTMAELLCYLADHGEDALVGHKINDKRKVGKVVSKRIYKTLIG